MDPGIAFEAVEAFITDNLSHIHTARIDPTDLEFEQRMEVLCFYCGRYNAKWTCPPRIPKLDYRRVCTEYSRALLVCYDTPIGDNYEKARNDSSVILHRDLLQIEDFLLQNGNAVRISFIGGSCKLCKNDCAADKCRNPYQARIPLEATGINVMKCAEKAGFDLAFPVKEVISRIGLILW